MDGLEQIAHLTRGIPQWALDSAKHPCHFRPGSEDKILILDARFALGLDLWNPADAWEPRSEWAPDGADDVYWDDDVE